MWKKILSLTLFLVGTSFSNASPVADTYEDKSKDAVVVTRAGGDPEVQGKLFTNDANQNNQIAAGLLGLGVGVGGVLLAQAFLEDQDKKKRPCHYRYRRDEGGVQGRFLGFGDSNKNKYDCYPPPPPHHGQGGYRPPPHGHGGYRPPGRYPPPPHGHNPHYNQQYNSGYAPSYNNYNNNNYRPPQHHNNGYAAPSRPNYQEPAPYRPPHNDGYRPPHNNGYRPPSNNYNTPVYRPPNNNYNTPVYRPNNQYAPDYREPYRQGSGNPFHARSLAKDGDGEQDKSAVNLSGRSLAPEEEKEEKSKNTGAVRFEG